MVSPGWRPSGVVGDVGVEPISPLDVDDDPGGGAAAAVPFDSPAAEEPWAAWYAVEAERLIRFATFVAGPDRAADAVQDAMVRALRTRTAIVDRRAFVNRLVVNEARRSAGREQRRADIEGRVVWLDTERDAEPSPELHAAVRELSPRQRAVVFLTYWEDLTPALVAVRLGCGEGTVRRQLARARARLRRSLDV